MRYAHFGEICEKCGNMRNMRQSHIRLKLKRLVWHDAAVSSRDRSWWCCCWHYRRAMTAVTVSTSITSIPASTSSKTQMSHVQGGGLSTSATANKHHQVFLEDRQRVNNLQISSRPKAVTSCSCYRLSWSPIIVGLKHIGPKFNLRHLVILPNFMAIG